MKQTAVLIFECADFVVAADEDGDTNPGVFGRSLAQWLALRLHAEGFPVGALFAEDFGWCIPIGGKPPTLYVVCSSTGHVAEEWRVFAYAESGIIARMLGIDGSAGALDEVFAAIRHCLDALPSVRGLREDAM